MPSETAEHSGQENRRQYNNLSSSLQTDSQGLLSDAQDAIQEVRTLLPLQAASLLPQLLPLHEVCMVPLSCQVRRELKTQTAAVGRLGSVESRLSSLEGSILSAGGCCCQGKPIQLVRAGAGRGASVTVLLSGGDNPKPFEGKV